MNSRGNGCSVVLGLAMLMAVPRQVMAQASELAVAPKPTESPSSAPQLVSLYVRNASDVLTVRVTPRDTSVSTIQTDHFCTSECDWDLPAGPYTVVTSLGKNQRKLRIGTQPLELASPTMLRAEDHGGARVAGLTLGLVGVGLAVFGGVMTFALSGLGGQTSGSAYETALTVSLVSLGAGVVLVPVGFSTFAQNRYPSVDVLPLANQPKPEPAPQGAGLSLRGKF